MITLRVRELEGDGDGAFQVGEGGLHVVVDDGDGVDTSHDAAVLGAHVCVVGGVVEQVVEGVVLAVGKYIALGLTGLQVDQLEPHVAIDIHVGGQRQRERQAAHLLYQGHQRQVFPSVGGGIKPHRLGRHLHDEVADALKNVLA